MTPAEVKEAQTLLDQLRALDYHLKRQLDESKSLQLPTKEGMGQTYVTVSPTLRRKTFLAWREEIKQQRAAVIRRLNQLNIEHGATNV